MINFKLVAIKLGESLKYDTTINDINRIASAIFDFPLSEYPHASITSSRSQLIYSWIMTLANTPINEEKKIEMLGDFIKGLTPNNSPLRNLILEENTNRNPKYRTSNLQDNNELVQLIQEGENFIDLMNKIDSGDSSGHLDKSEIKQWLHDVIKWASKKNIKIPEPGEIFDIFSWDHPVRAYVSRVTHLLESYNGIENESVRFEFDIALSFAGEDRKYAEDLARCLIQSNIKVFYDNYEIVDLWGKDLYEHLAWIYRDAAKFCVMFISKNFAEKLWTNHERKNAQARAFKDKQEYILPIKLDDTTIAGLPDTIGYIDIRHTSVSEICKLLIKKLEKWDSEHRN